MLHDETENKCKMMFNVLETKDDLLIYQRLYKENKRNFYFTALRILHNETDAEDAVHNGFLKLANKFSEYRGQPYENLVRLTHTIIKNAAMDIAREYERKAEFSEESGFGEDNVQDMDPGILDRIIKQEEEERLLNAVMGLTEGERQLLHMQYEMQLKPQEIGRLLGLSSGVVRKRVLRARYKLAEILEKDK